jgi:hypothetical protein
VTVLRSFRDAISNWFNAIEEGVGKRGSTFTDIDAVSHDLDTSRFLFREFKHKDEALHKAQKWVLRDLANLPRCTVWFVRKIDSDHVGWARFGSGQPDEKTITVTEYRALLAAWWRNEPEPVVDVAACVQCGRDSCEGHDEKPDVVPLGELTAKNIPW